MHMPIVHSGVRPTLSSRFSDYKYRQFPLEGHKLFENPAVAGPGTCGQRREDLFGISWLLNEPLALAVVPRACCLAQGGKPDVTDRVRQLIGGLEDREGRNRKTVNLQKLLLVNVIAMNS